MVPGAPRRRKSIDFAARKAPPAGKFCRQISWLRLGQNLGDNSEMAAEPQKEVPMSDGDQIYYHVQSVIFRWCGAAAGTYGSAAALQDLWSQAYSDVDYDSEGIHRLLSRVYDDPLFQECAQAHELTPGMFVAGGEIQTVDDLYSSLTPCANPALGFTSSG
jgi:hypothetical protein